MVQDCCLLYTCKILDGLIFCFSFFFFPLTFDISFPLLGGLVRIFLSIIMNLHTFCYDWECSLSVTTDQFNCICLGVVEE